MPIVAGITEPEAREEAEPRLRIRAELSMTELPGIVETDASVKSGLEKAIDGPMAAEAFPTMAFLSSSTLEESPPPVFPSSDMR